MVRDRGHSFVGKQGNIYKLILGKGHGISVMVMEHGKYMQIPINGGKHATN